MPSIDQYSVAARPIQMFFQQTYLSLGTAFVWKHGSDHYLVTNWHNVSGKDPRTGQHLSKTLAEPDQVKAWWNVKGNLGAKISTMVPLRSADGEPLWWIHPKYGRKVDVIALPVSPPPNTDMHPINEMPSLNLRLEVGQDIFILGYPFGVGSLGLPIWKRGSIASEPEVLDVNDPHILVDTASRPGMSGSPVIRKSWNTHQLDDGNVSIGTGSAYRFVGVYSGRLATTDQYDAQLGMVWPTQLLDEIIAGGKVDA
jgi:hypothetical protein